MGTLVVKVPGMDSVMDKMERFTKAVVANDAKVSGKIVEVGERVVVKIINDLNTV